MRHLFFVILSMVSMASYIKFQSKFLSNAKDGKELSDGIIAQVFACDTFLPRHGWALTTEPPRFRGDMVRAHLRANCKSEHPHHGDGRPRESRRWRRTLSRIEPRRRLRQPRAQHADHASFAHRRS